MDNYIIYNKSLELERHKESVLRIPAIFSPANSEFIIEVDEAVLKQPATVELSFRDPRQNAGNQPISVRVELTRQVSRFKADSDFGLTAKDLLFMSVRSNASFKVILSVKEVNSKG